MTSPTDSTKSTAVVPTAVVQNGLIYAQTFQQMLQILDDLTDHTHSVTDTYTSVCECDCGRGII